MPKLAHKDPASPTTVRLGKEILEQADARIPGLQAQWNKRLGPFAPKVKRADVLRVAITRGMKYMRKGEQGL